MDGGTYNNVVRTSSPFSASSPTTSSNAYKANVNRTKTRKWVEARVQNYDGDDWGNDYDDDDDEPEELAPKPLQKAPTGGLPSTLRSISQPLQPRSADATEPYGRRSFGGPDVASSNQQHGASFAVPASQQQSTAVQPQDQPSYTLSTPPAAQPFATPDAPKNSTQVQDAPTTMNAAFPPRKSSMTSAGPLQQGGYELRDEPQPGYGASTQPHDSQGAPGSSPPSEGNKPKLAATSSSGLDSQPKVQKSISPQLPEVSRMSMFGDDFFSTGIQEASTPKTTTIAPVQETEERRPQSPSVSETKTPAADTNGGSQSVVEPQATKKTTHGRVARPSLPGGWVSETTNVDSVVPTPLETPGLSGPAAYIDQPGTTLPSGPSSTATSANNAPAGTAGTSDATRVQTGESIAASSSPAIEASQHPKPQSLPPLETSNPLKGATDTMHEKSIVQASTSDSAPASSVYQQSPQTASNLPSTTASPSDRGPAAMPVYSQHENANHTFAPPLGAPRKSTLSSVTTASPLKESDMLREEIMKSLSPAVDTPTSAARLGPQTASELPRESRSLSGIYDDYYGFQEDKALQETGRYLKSESQTPQESGDDTSRTQPAVTSGATTLPEIRPLSPNKQGAAKPQISTTNRERRFSFDAGPENVTLSPVEAPTSSAVSFGSNSDRQATRPEYKAAERTESISGPTPLDQAVSSGPETGQLHASAQTITHQVSQMSIGATDNVDVNMIDQPSPLSGSKSGTPRGTTPVPMEDKVLIQPDSKTAVEHHTPETESRPIFVSNEPEALPEAGNSPNPATNTSAKIMPFREILSIGLPHHRIQKFDETREQFFNMDTGLGEWLRHMQSHGDGAAGNPSYGANEIASPTGAPASQQPYYQQYLNASNPNLSMPPPARTNTGNLGGQSPNLPQGQQGFNTGGQVGTKGKELLQAAGVLGNKGVKTGMKFFNKSKTKLRERGDKVFN